ncbi:MFS transporter [Roseomonas terrae]|uniref:MFS transporter n=1 Tax=Neoroseomonas terrae TaxID=424799 RepID=A0ABS5EH17_9PROT|nr:MFS transporter [Neoroseomonas terrae]MBR0650324.1 MFS transporter [Neoroseomonas terrae]
MSTPDFDPARSPVPQLLTNAAFRRLWLAGGLTNSMRWLDMLVSGLFTFELTGSAFAVSLVLMARALPMLLMGALAGALAESLDRRRLLMVGQGAQAASALAIAVLALAGWLAPWHLFVNGVVGGLAWTNELATRRRMVAEAAGPTLIVQAVAFDSMTGSTTRMIGPLVGGFTYESVGVAGAFLIAAAVYLVAAASVHGVAHRQESRALRLGGLATEIAEAARIAIAVPALRLVLGITVVMNVFGFSYTGILPAWGTVTFQATPFGIGLLAAAEPFGALLTGFALAMRRGAAPGRMVLAAGVGGFLGILALAAMAPTLPLAALLLLVGGLGTAAFASLQTGLVLTHAPPEARSRILGLTTTCIGTGPLGVLLLGALADAHGPRLAIAGMAVAGLIGLGLVMATTRR